MTHSDISAQKATISEPISRPFLKIKGILKQQNIFLLLIVSLLIILVVNQLYAWDKEKSAEQIQTAHYLTSPKIDDLYFLDFRKLSTALRPKEKLKLAKIVDLTGDVVTLLYGDFYYSQHSQIKSSIHYGHLRYRDYFQGRRYDFTLDQLTSMRASGAIYLIKRPHYNQLYGNYIKPIKAQEVSDIFIPGRSENNSGEAFLMAKNIENNRESALAYFQQSADLGFPKGQVNLAELYLSKTLGEKDLLKSLFWLKKAAKQSHKPAILKYVIVCKQVALCSEYDFYQELVDAGVNLKVRNMDFTLQ